MCSQLATSERGKTPAESQAPRFAAPREGLKMQAAWVPGTSARHRCSMSALTLGHAWARDGGRISEACGRASVAQAAED
eukprot:scaffold2576_cov418-Prasinococcus_capsulatus_cf.AAC.5